MPVTLNASTASGLIATSDTSGNIELQNNGTTRLTVNSTGATITGTQSVSGDLSFNSGYGSAAVAYGCRAWVNFNGTGTPAIRASGNVSSITDNNTGDYTVNFTTAMPDANYAISGLGGSGSADNRVLVGQGVSQTSASGSCRIATSNSTVATLTDFDRVYVAIFR
jgi:uncharacterized protein (AIM24 family)